MARFRFLRVLLVFVLAVSVLVAVEGTSAVSVGAETVPDGLSGFLAYSESGFSGEADQSFHRSFVYTVNNGEVFAEAGYSGKNVIPGECLKTESSTSGPSLPEPGSVTLTERHPTIPGGYSIVGDPISLPTVIITTVTWSGEDCPDSTTSSATGSISSGGGPPSGWPTGFTGGTFALDRPDGWTFAEADVFANTWVFVSTPGSWSITKTWSWILVRDVCDSVIDMDGDGFTDCEEVEEGTDPTDPTDFPAANRPPVAERDSYTFPTCGTFPVSPSPLANDTDPDGDSLTITNLVPGGPSVVVDDPVLGLIAIVGPSGYGLSFYTANDGEYDSNVASIFIDGVACAVDTSVHVGRRSPGDSVPLSGDGYDPGSTVGVWLTSDPVLLGLVEAAVDGTVSTTATIPVDTEPGEHTLWLIGNDPSGESRALTFTIDVVLDLDGDGIIDPDDNCVNTPNPGQEDFDGDGAGDACDDDIDGDTVLNAADMCEWTGSDTIIQDDLKKRRYAWYGPGEEFVSGGNNSPVFTIADTGGCSADQIILLEDLGNGHGRFGISKGALTAWVEYVASS